MAHKTKVTKKNKRGKPTFLYTIILLTIILSILPFVLPAEWTQYIPSPVSSNINYIKATNGKAMGYTSGANVIYYDGSNWNEISKPSGMYDTFYSLDKATDNNFYWLFINSSNPVYAQIWKYDGAWTLESDNNYTSEPSSLACIEIGNGYTGGNNDAECFVSLVNTSVYGVLDASNISVPSLSGGYSLMGGNQLAYLRLSTNYYWYLFNGVSWQSQGIAFGGGDHFIISYSSTKKIMLSTGQPIFFYNSSSATYVSPYSEIYPQRGIYNPNNNKVYFTNGQDMREISYYGTSSQSLINASQTIKSMDYDYIINTAWAGGNNGVLYQLGGIGGGAGSIIQTVGTNPLSAGQKTNLSITPSHPSSYKSNITTTITGNCSLISPLYYYNFNINSNYTINIEINSANYIAGTCTIHTIAYFSNGDTATATDIIMVFTGEVYDTDTRVDPNPTTYGNQVIFYGKGTNPIGNPSNLTLKIYDSNLSTLIYEAPVSVDVPNGIETELYRLTTNDLNWGTFPIGGYIVETEGCTINSTNEVICGIGNEEPDLGIVAWDVTQGQMQNLTKYKATPYQKSPDDIGFNGIYSITQYDANNLYTSIQNGNKPYIASWDITNKQNIIYNRQTTSLKEQSGRNGNPTTISAVDMIQGTDNLYIGTNDDLFIYTNASNKKADGLIYDFDKGFGILSNDGITDVSGKDTNYTYVCQDGAGIDNDDIYLYNKTLADFQDQMNNNPCQSIKYDGWVYAHRGSNNDVKIWNANNQTNVATIDFTKTISTLAYNDLLDISNDYLFFIAGKDEIRKYDVSNHTNPVIAGKCFTNQTNEEIDSIEAVNNNEVIIGVYNPTDHLDIIYVCDFGNNETYNAGKGGYVAQHLFGISGDQAWEIMKNDNQGKFSIAEGNMIEVFYYEKTNETITINDNPIIDDHTFTPSKTLCKNQQVSIEIIAHDPNPDDYLSYGVSCTGGGTPYSWSAYNILTCYYTSVGTNIVTTQVKDNWGAYSTALHDTITVNNCNYTTATTLFYKIIDGQTNAPVMGASVSLYDNTTLLGTQISDALGYVNFTGITTYKLYRAYVIANNYAPKSSYNYPSDSRYLVALEQVNGTERTILVVTVYDSNNQPLENALVSTLDPITGSSKYGLTDYTGIIYLFDVMPSNNFIIGAKKDGYATTSIYASIGSGEQKMLSITMGQSRGAGGYFPATPRICADTIKGVWLCGNLSVTGIGNTCTQDADCISGRCSFGISIRECSKFNYTLCDAQGINRGNTCIIKNMTGGFFRTIGDLLLGNFLYVLILVSLIVAGLIIRRSLKG